MDTSKTAAPMKIVSPADPISVFLFKPAVVPTKLSTGLEGHNSHLKTLKQRLSRKKKKKKKQAMKRKPICSGLRETEKEEISKLYVSSSCSDEVFGPYFPDVFLQLTPPDHLLR